MKERVKINKKIQKNNSSEDIFFIPVRYLILLMCIFSLTLVYKIFTPLTVYPVVFLLKIFYNVSLSGELIIINLNTVISIIPACIAGSAYLLLLILNLTVPMAIGKRIYSIALSFLLLLMLNILRIFLLAVLYYNNFYYFDITHKVFWYFLSTIFVVGIWFLIVKIFSIKEIPVYSDFARLYNNSKKKK